MLFGGNSNAQKSVDEEAKQVAEQVKSFKDFLYSYNRLSEMCFNECVWDFTTRNVRDKEDSCASNCAEKYLKMNQRISQRFQEFQVISNENALAMAKKAESYLRRTLNWNEREFRLEPITFTCESHNRRGIDRQGDSDNGERDGVSTWIHPKHLHTMKQFLTARVHELEAAVHTVHYARGPATEIKMLPIVSGFHLKAGNFMTPPSLLQLGMRFAMFGDGSSNRRNSVPAWKKDACLSSEPPENSHFICTPDGDIKCLEGWAGDLCDVPICRKGCDPLHGYCNQPGECKCKLGYAGPLCNSCMPMLGCAHGSCNKSFECNCDPGWDGILCTNALCAKDCHPVRGYCERPGECRCRLGWTGRNCSDCQILPGCKNGFCNKPLECNCKSGWTGLLCQIPICKATCSKEHGYCEEPGECRCRLGWWGPDCGDCFPYPGCQNGYCSKPWECKCKPGWTGFLCDKRLSSCSLNPDFCLSGGICFETETELKCKCPEGTLGVRCEIRYAKNSTLASDIEFPAISPTAREAQNATIETSTLGSTTVTDNPQSTTSLPSSDEVALRIYKIVDVERPADGNFFVPPGADANVVSTLIKVTFDKNKNATEIKKVATEKSIEPENPSAIDKTEESRR